MADIIELGKTLRMLLTNRKGVTALEYGLIAALMAAIIIGAFGTLGTSLTNLMTAIAGHMSLS